MSLNDEESIRFPFKIEKENKSVLYYLKAMTSSKNWIMLVGFTTDTQVVYMAQIMKYLLDF